MTNMGHMNEAKKALKRWFALVRLKVFQKQLIRSIKGETCLLIGSAPDPQIPTREHYSRCVCVNGSPFVAHQNAIAVDLTIFGGWSITQSKNPERKSWYKLRNLRGLSTETLLYLEVSSSATKAKKIFEDFEFAYSKFLQMGPDLREIIVESAVGRLPELDGHRMVSNGVFSLALLMWLGAREIILTGFSFGPGHSSLTKNFIDASAVKVDHRRAHVEIDRYFLEKARMSHQGIYAMDPSFAEEVGLPLWNASSSQADNNR